MNLDLKVFLFKQHIRTFIYLKFFTSTKAAKHYRDRKPRKNTRPSVGYSKPIPAGEEASMS